MTISPLLNTNGKSTDGGGGGGNGNGNGRGPRGIKSTGGGVEKIRKSFATWSLKKSVLY
jgi:hypothetical protein